MSKSSDARRAARRRAERDKRKNAGADASASVVSPAVHAALTIPKKRHGCGKIVAVCRTPRKETPDQIKRTVTAQRTKLAGEKNADRREAATVLGRLWLEKTITRVMYEAGEHYAFVAQQGRRVDGYAPLTPQAMDLSSSGGLSTAAPDLGLDAIRAKRRYESAAQLLLKSGHRVYAEVDAVCTEDIVPTCLSDLRAGLSVLVVHFGIIFPRMSEAC